MTRKTLLPGLLMAAAAAFACCLPAQADDTLTLNYTAKLRWGAQTGTPGGIGTVLADLPVSVGADGYFNVSGTITVGLTAPVVTGFNPLSGYWSEEALQGYTLAIGGRSFSWVNLPGSLDNRWGLTLNNGNAAISADVISTANAALPTFGGISPAISSTAAGNGLLSVQQPVANTTHSLALGTAMFWLYGAGILNSNALTASNFSTLSGMTIGDSNATGGTQLASRLFVQFLALPTGSTEPSQHINAQNADGYFTSVALAVPEPGSWALLACGLAAVTWRAKRARPVIRT